MKRILLTLTCLLAFAVSAFSAEDRMQVLPQDQTTWYLTIFGEADDAQYATLKSWMVDDKGLASLRTQTRYKEYTTDKVRYQRYAADMPGLPCIRLQTAQGIVVSEFWDENFPTTSAELFRGMRSDMKRKTSWGCIRKRRKNNCPVKPDPKPEPPAPPVIVPEPPTGPPVFEDDPKVDAESNLWLVLVVLGAIGGAAVGLVQEYKAEHLDKPTVTSTKL